MKDFKKARALFKKIETLEQEILALERLLEKVLLTDEVKVYVEYPYQNESKDTKNGGDAQTIVIQPPLRISSKGIQIPSSGTLTHSEVLQPKEFVTVFKTLLILKQFHRKELVSEFNELSLNIKL